MNEAENLRRMVELWTGSDAVVIPGVIDEASSRRVLTMEYVAGYPLHEACDHRTKRATTHGRRRCAIAGGPCCSTSCCAACSNTG
jgi:predicted unusual protein kinase regulating ubiquinone biosynthesis (AarF/ABC1/UbiB family)